MSMYHGYRWSAHAPSHLSVNLMMFTGAVTVLLLLQPGPAQSLEGPAARGVWQTAVADTQWRTNGVPVCTATGSQVHPGCVTDGSNGAVIGWQTQYLGSGARVFAGRIRSDGTIPVEWPSEGVALSDTVLNISGPVVVPDDQGGAYLVWTEVLYARPSALKVQHIDGSGAVAPGWPARGIHVGGDGSNQYFPRAAGDDSGGVYVAWLDDRNGASNPDPFLLRILRDGTTATGWAADGNALTTGAGYQTWPLLVADGTGGAIAMWLEPSGVTAATRMLRSGTRAAGWSAGGVALRTDTTTVSQLALAEDDGGGAFACWREDRTGKVWVQHLESTGNTDSEWPANGRTVGPPESIQDSPSLCHDGGGNVYVTWWDVNAYDFLYAMRVLASGQDAPGWPAEGKALSIGWIMARGGPVLRSESDHTLHVFWGEYRYLSPTDVDLFHICVSVDGEFLADWSSPRVICNAPSVQIYPTVLQCPDGWLVAWSDYRSGNNYDLYAARITSDGTVPTTGFILSEVTAGPTAVRIRWRGARTNLALRVQRRTGSITWTSRGQVESDNSGLVEFDDTDVAPGEEYFYRLVAADGLVLSEEVRALVPRPWSLALEPSTPCPTKGHLDLSFTLPAPGPARLEVFDVCGRRLRTWDIGVAAAGRQGLSTGIRTAGVYVVRLSQGMERATRRYVVLR